LEKANEFAWIYGDVFWYLKAEALTRLFSRAPFLDNLSGSFIFSVTNKEDEDVVKVRNLTARIIAVGLVKHLR